MNHDKHEGWTGEYLPGNNTRTVPFTAGDGISEYIEVHHIAEFPRGAHGHCAYCAGDPCAESPPTLETRQIHDYYLRASLRYRKQGYGHRPESCPCCDGRPA